MTTNPIHKRQFRAFLSHAHANKAVVEHLYTWLSEQGGIPVWYDSVNLPASTMIGTYLPKAIAQCRTMILVLSEASVQSGWVQEEYNAAVGQRTQFKEYRIIPIRIEECEVPGFLQTTKWLDLPDGMLDLNSAYDLLASLYYGDATLPSLGKAQDIYVSRTWRESEAPLADHVCKLLDKAGFRLIGDSKDQAGFEEGKRVESIISSCGGLVAILPDRGQGQTSKYMLQEIETAQNFDLPCLIVAESSVKIPDSIDNPVIRMSADNIGGADSNEDALQEHIEILAEEWRRPIRPHYAFFSTDLEEAYKQRNQTAKSILELVTATECKMGDRLREPGIQQIIADRISEAFVMIADISENNLNTCIEAGIARGAKTRFHLVACEPRHRPPFMLSDYQVYHYANEVDLLGIVHNIAYPYRRRILNYELPR